MTALLKEVEVELTNAEESVITSDKAKYFVKLSKLIEMAQAERVRVSVELSENDKDEVFKALQKDHNIPEYITVHDAAEILEVSTQMVRRYCAEGKLDAMQRFEGSGKWLIETKQFMKDKNWDKFIQKRAKIKDSSLKLASKMLEILDEDAQ